MTKRVTKTTQGKSSKRLESKLFMSRYQRSDDTVSRKNSEGDVVILSLHRPGVFFKIDGIAGLLWDKLDGKRAFALILKSVLKESERDIEDYFAKAEMFLKQLLKNSLVEKV